jgi:hypothetical protein
VHKKPTEQSPDVQQPIVQPMVDEMTKPSKAPQADEKAPPVGPLTPPKSAELDQDPGGGYNANHVIPQP